MLRGVLFHIVLIAVVFGIAHILSSDETIIETKKGAGLNIPDPPTRLGISGRGLMERSGRYYLSPSLDSEFSDFAYINLTENENELRNAALSPADSGELRLASLTIRDDAVTFTTTGPDHFVFTGVFRSKPRCAISPDPGRMEGQLIKLKEGKVVAVMNAAFYRVFGC